MAQIVYCLSRGPDCCLELPNPEDPVVDGVVWGRCDQVFTPAYWATQVWLHQGLGKRPLSFRIGTTIIEEIAACLLGGHGIPAPVALAVFRRVRDRGLLEGTPSCETLYKALQEPVVVAGREIRYRFAKQRGQYLSEILQMLHRENTGITDAIEFRNWLMQFRGIGPKTSSWIVRNWLGSDEIAIIDIHIHRAGLLCGLFNRSDSVQRHYFKMEERFLAFAAGIGVRASLLDSLMWYQMRNIGFLARSILRDMDESLYGKRLYGESPQRGG